MNGQNEGSPRIQVTLADMMPLFQEQLAAGQKVRFIPHGNSMWPMLRSGRDAVELSPLPPRLKKYDLPLYQRACGNYVLHRIVRIAPDGFNCMGDGQLRIEPGVQKAQMIGVVTAFCREGRWYPITHPGYMLYCRLWPACKLVWRCWKRLRRVLHRKICNGEEPK